MEYIYINIININIDIIFSCYYINIINININYIKYIIYKFILIYFSENNI